MGVTLRVVGAVVLGVLLGPVLRAQIHRYAVPVGEPWRDASRAWSFRTGPRLGVVEAVAAAVLALVAWRVPEPLVLLAVAWVAVFGVVLAFVDLAVHRLPDRLTLTAFGGGLVLFGLSAVVDGEYGPLWSAVVCALAVSAFYLILAVASPAGMGLGDVKAALSVGLVAGWFGLGVALAAAVAGFLLAGLYAAALLVLRKAGRKDHIAHGPFLLLGALIALTVAA
ncbi:prepilin peptidase [Phytohabitans rumicis]|uniref:Prepilin type IV endopeptidase peptidase domain-containing protein n=1 Tax=Phytohabitans rumicis TaxID=1076125 RepID=A0A6V8L2H0_9ACTN|nr:A24 family peptidase [Phytohabitans rumicis]GFJ90344.1 hypothetical protein Prum_039860 [Phytohabitans rumicis]